MAKVASKSVNFSPNEALAYTDLADIGRVATQRAWEAPEYSNIITPWRQLGLADWGVGFDTPTDFQKVAYTKGSGLMMGAVGLDMAITAGFVGQYVGTAPPAAMDLVTPIPSMRWAWISGFELITIPAAAAGQTRYTLVYASIADAASDVVARHFKSAASGAKSSASTAKRRSQTLTISTTTGASAVIPTMPVLPAGQMLLAVVLSNNTAVTQVQDCTVPFGPMREQVLHPGIDGFYSASTIGVSAPTLTFNAGGGFCNFYLRGAPSERLLALEIHHTMTAAASTVVLRKWDGSVYNTLATYTGNGVDFASDGTLRTLRINTLGAPISVGGAGEILTPPLWLDGEYSKNCFASTPAKCLNVNLSSDLGTIKAMRVFSVVG